jgi:hypothetical protein
LPNEPPVPNEQLHATTPAVYVPDAVLYEATVKSDALGAQSIAEWVQRHSQQVYPLVTQVFTDHLAMLGAGLRTPRDLDERAAIEAIRHTLVLAQDERAIFITEDDRLLSGTYVVLARTSFLWNR